MTGKRISTLLFIIIAGIFLLQANVHAKEPQFRLDIDSIKLSRGESANLALSIIDAQDGEVTNIQGIEDFDVVSKNTSVSTQVINGDATIQRSFNYTIMPKKAGKFTLCGNVNYNGNTYQTNVLQIEVVEGNSTQDEEARDIFVKTILSDNEIYLGQKVVLTYELYSRYSIENFGLLDKTDINGFIKKEIPEDKLKADYVYVNGKKYVKYEAKQMYLSPTKAGTFTIPSFKFQANVSTGDFFSSSKPFYMQTDAKEIKVKSLPLNNQPGDFFGIVGNLSVEAKYSKQEIDLKDSLALNVTLSGDCSLDGVKKLIKDSLPGFSVYETEKKAEEGIVDNKYNVKKEFEIILVPEKNGDIKIEPVYIPFFNPKSGDYEKAEIPGTTIRVKGDMPQNQFQAQSGINGGSSSAPIETIKIDQVSYEPKNDGYMTLKFKKNNVIIGLAIFIFLLIVAAAAFWLISYQKKQDRNLFYFYKQLNNADDHNEIYNIFNNMIKYRFNISLKASPRRLIIDKLSDCELVNPVLEVMDYMENKKEPSNQDKLYLKGKIKEIYKKLMNSKSL
ncbi:BatD family protein [Pseudobacteroides cellulosolvens]|uniref:Aerotolerance-related protein BatD n=1 Tax=Pseudobacteroides cellulosolvens ATCC 35603 = DSM 2933 TaxID=398512 RepID=A0A0L6JSH0_9FIRM|nr:BatD family protein [Pseudobacteroides cellulosolvens]KNY28675.1 Aerotolerance-related protein BatD [Pseudobacteroides cellulosolvens ATCC 35603 = DSM 2933]